MENIIALVPQGEHFDASAVNEGVWVSQGHLNNIEAALASAGIERVTLTEQVTEAQNDIATAAANLTTANATITERDNTIAEQAAEIARLKAGPAGNMQTTEKSADDLGDNQVVESETTKEARRLRALRDGK